RRFSTLDMHWFSFPQGSGLDPHRAKRGRPRRILGRMQATRRAALVLCAAAGAGCAAVGESPRTPYAVPPPASSGAESGPSGAAPSFSIAARGPGGSAMQPGVLGTAAAPLADRIGLFAA